MKGFYREETEDKQNTEADIIQTVKSWGQNINPVEHKIHHRLKNLGLLSKLSL